MTIDTDRSAIQDLLNRRRDAFAAGDARTICDGYAADAVVFNLAPPLAQPLGGANDAIALQAWLDEKGGAVFLQVQDETITVSGDLAVSTSLTSMGAPPNSPQSFTMWFRSTVALRRIATGWTIFHEHESTPFYMDGLENGARAAVDLQP